MYELIIYRALTNPYMRLVRVADGGIVNATTGLVAQDTSWADSVKTLAKVTLVGGIPITMPPELEPGNYDMLIYDAGSPADSDPVKIGRRIAWTGLLVAGLPVDV